MIRALAQDEPMLYKDFLRAKRKVEGESHLIRDTACYPLSAIGDFNLYALFAENMLSRISQEGFVGCVIPSGIATDYTYRLFFEDITKSNKLVSLFDFENRKKLFGMGQRARETAELWPVERGVKIIKSIFVE